MKKHILTVLLLLAAMGFYSLGAAGPGTIFLLAGALAEGAFWYRVFRKTRS